ncbi:DUF1707 domain-containing protein [Micromonospora sp. NPDC049523]|uniref:DUF1707 SHOCT-like domain-containing protein n=1 Tax=Micromonospora sp. NPDC049523 TaxID=3155921 RepID=UPI003431AF46
MERRGEMRAADADRQLVAERLRLAVDEGRLDLYEYDDRLRAAYAAKTYAELDDLPEPVPAQQAEVVRQDGALVPDPDGRYPGATRRWLAENWAPYFSVVTITVAGWAVFSLMAWELLYFWPIWVAGPWGAVLLASTVSGLAQGKPQRVAAQRARKKAAKRARREQLAEGPEPEPGPASLPPPGEREGWQLGGKAD